MPPEIKPSAEDSFRTSLEDVILILEKLSPHCDSTSDMMGMLKLAMENDGQLQLLMSMVVSKK